MRRAWVAALLLGRAALAHDIISTKLLWTQDISRIVYRHCASCHREGGSAMSLISYEDARPWAKAIRDEVLARRMPPWGAVKGVGDFRDDPSLSQVEIDLIVNWVEGGAPKGDDEFLPPAPHFETARQPEPAREFAVSTAAASTLAAENTAIGIRPVHIEAGASMEVATERPDGSIERLIWIRDWRPEWQRTFYFRRPLVLPKGTRILVYSENPAKAAIALAP
jgi:hypothetical protein